MMYKDFTELDVWKKGFHLSMEIYDITDTFPDSEKYALTSQIRRSSNSVIANIAESHGRFSYADKIRVLYITRGEICETRSHLLVASGRKYISEEQFSKINSEYLILTKQLNSYINSLNSH